MKFLGAPHVTGLFVAGAVGVLLLIGVESRIQKKSFDALHNSVPDAVPKP